MTEKQMRRKMQKIVKLATALWQENDELFDELRQIGCDTEYLSDGSGAGLEELALGTDVVDELMHRIFVEKDICPKDNIWE